MRTAVLGILIITAVLLGVSTLQAEEPAPPSPAPPASGPASPDSERIERLASQLGSSDFATRERAGKELLAIGEPARKALEHTMTHSDNMEARWRAEQILRRMDREGTLPMTEERPAPTPRPIPMGPRLGQPGRGMEELERHVDDLRRRMDKRFEGLDRFFDERQMLEAPGLRLEITTFGSILARLKLAVEGHNRNYHGSSLEEILRRYPQLAKLPGMEELARKWKLHREKHPNIFGFADIFRPESFIELHTRSSGQGVDIFQDGDRVRVKIRETGPDGKATVREYEGESLDDIKKQHPEISEKLKGFGFAFRIGPPQIFRRRPGGARVPVPPAPKPWPRPVAPEEAKPRVPVFGVEIEEPEAVLAAHLQLEPGHGALVRQVVPGSQAEAIGLRRFDMILAVESAAAREFRTIGDALQKAAKNDREPITIRIVRAGKELTLSR